MVQWTRVATEVGVGGAAGVVDQLLQNQDDQRIAEEPDLSMWREYGTYYNYGIPILAIIATSLGFVRGDWANRSILVGSQLAGRKATMRFIKQKPVPFTQFGRQHQLEAARQRALNQARKQIGGEPSDITIPIVSDETMLV